MALSDDALIERVRAGDAAAFDALYARFAAPLHRYVLGTVRDEAVADDLVQEVFLRVWTRAEQWDARGAVRVWLYRIGLNLAINHLRAARRRPSLPLDAPAAQGEDEENDGGGLPGWLVDSASLGPEAAVEQGEQARLLRRLVEELPEEKREVFRLVRDAEMEPREIAAVLGIPEGTVRSRLHYGRKQLARQWRGVWTAEEEH
jgi:RNA polymerase sigma-70 factor (ECF subfamily)